jgi:hypothetical protein
VFALWCYSAAHAIERLPALHHDHCSAVCFTSRAKKEEAPKAVYKIVSYRAEPCGDRVCGGEWTVSRVGMQPKVKMTLVCSFYKWGQRERVEGPAACNLRVGDTLIPNLLPQKKADFLDVWQLNSEILIVVQGDGDDKVEQHFWIKSSTVVE